MNSVQITKDATPEEILANTATIGRRLNDIAKAKQIEDKTSIWDKLEDDNENHEISGLIEKTINDDMNNSENESLNLKNGIEDNEDSLKENKNFSSLNKNKTDDDDFGFPEVTIEMAELYEKQELYYEALEIYKELIAKDKENEDLNKAVQRVLDKIFVFEISGYSELARKIFSQEEFKKFLILPSYQYSKMQQVLGKQEQDDVPINLTVTLNEHNNSNLNPVADFINKHSTATVKDFTEILIKIAGENKKLSALTLGEILQAAKILEE